jgi:hypothetical protein
MIKNLREIFGKSMDIMVELSNKLRINPSIEEEKIFAPIIQKYNELTELLEELNMSLFDLIDIPFLSDLKTTVCNRCEKYCFKVKRICGLDSHPPLCLKCSEQYVCEKCNE